MAMKKVGGPARNVIRSRATSASACSGSKRRTSTDRSPAAPGTRTPLSSPEMCAIGAGMSTASEGPEPVHAGHERRLPAQAALRVQHRLGHPGGAGGEQHQRDVGRPARARARPDGRAPERLGERRRVGDGLRRELDDEGGVDLTQRRLHVCGPERVEDRRGHRAEAPAGPGEHRRGQAVGNLPRHRVAPSSRRAPAARPRRWPRGRLPGRPRAGCHRRPPRRRGPRSAHPGSGRPRAHRPAGRRGRGSAPRSVGGGRSRQGTIPGSR